MRPSLFLFAFALGGCASTAVVPPPPPPPAVRVEAVPNPVPVVIETQPAEVVPVQPPPVRERVIAQRSVYEIDRVAEWTLRNGLTVVYAWDDDADGYRGLVSAPASVGERRAELRDGDVLQVGADRQTATASGSRLEDVMEILTAQAQSRTASTLVLMHGALGPEWVEPLVAERLGTLAQTRAADRPAPGATAADWDDFSALWIASRVLAARAASGAPLALAFDPATETASVRAARSVALNSLLAPASDADFRTARTRAAADARQPDGLLLALDALYQLPGRYRPSRPVSDARGLADAIERTPSSRVAAILSRLSSTTPR